MKTKNLILLILVSLYASSCNKILDIPVKDFLTTENYYETETQLNYALNGVYDNLGSSELYAYAMLGRMGLDVDDGFYRGSQTTGVFVNDANPMDPDVFKFWTACYRGIARANLLLDNIHKPNMDETKRGVIKGEALFLRSHFYVMLISNFGGVPMIMKSVESPFDTQRAKTLPKEAYQMILDDMEEASTLVESAAVVGFGGRINKSAIWGEMARLCLYMAGEPVNDQTKWAEARKWAKKVMDEGIHDLNPSFSQVFINYGQDLYDIKESIWEIEFSGNGLDAYRETGRVGSNNGIQSKDEVLGSANGFTWATGRLYRKFQSDDLRRDYSIATFYLSGNPAREKKWGSTSIYERSCGKFRRENEPSATTKTANTNQNYPIVRYADVLLMFAEADNELHPNGPSEEGYEAINQVRRRARGKSVNTKDPQIDLGGMKRSAFREEIQDERSRELSFESLRKYDLVRWGKFVTNMALVAQDFKVDVMKDDTREKSVGYDNAEPRDVRWPIPQKELNVNKLLIQNEGWL